LLLNRFHQWKLLRLLFVLPARMSWSQSLSTSMIYSVRPPRMRVSLQTLLGSVAKEAELEVPVENIGAQLVRPVAAKTNDLAKGETTTYVVFLLKVCSRSHLTRTQLTLKMNIDLIVILMMIMVLIRVRVLGW